jgi:hypothetical protein
VSVAEEVYLGVSLSEAAIRVSASTGQRSAITSAQLAAPGDWFELITYGLALPESHRLLGCVALPSGAPRETRDALTRAAREAGWDGLLVVSGVLAAGRALRSHACKEAEELAVALVDQGLTSVGIVRGTPPRLVQDDPVRSIGGREAREVAVSLRCLLKARPRAEVRGLLQRVLVVGDEEEVQRIGRSAFVREIEGLGAREVSFELDPFLVAQGALELAKGTGPQTWRRLNRRAQ